MRFYPDIETTILSAPTGIQLHPRIWSKDPGHADALLNEITGRMALALGEYLYSTRGETLEEVVAGLLTENRATVAVAESCTGRDARRAAHEYRGKFGVFFGRRGLLQQ